MGCYARYVCLSRSRGGTYRYFFYFFHYYVFVYIVQMEKQDAQAEQQQEIPVAAQFQNPQWNTALADSVGPKIADDVR